MKHIFFRRVSALLLAAALSLSLAAPAWADAADTASVSITGDAQAKVGGQVRLEAVIAPAGTAYTNVQWSCRPSGTVTPDAGDPTKATLTAGQTGEIVVEVTVDTLPTASHSVTFVPSLTLDFTALSLQAGTTQQLTASVLPAGQEVAWSSADAEVASVGENGLVTAHKAGTAVITATARYGDAANEAVTASCTVTVTEIPVDSVVISTYNDGDNPLILERGQSEQVGVSVTPPGAAQALTWSTGDPGVATVDGKGRVTAVGVGKTTLTAKVGNTADTCRVEVSGVVLSTNALELYLGGQGVTPTFTTYGSASAKQGAAVQRYWQSDDPLVAAVNRSTGTITPRGVGEAYITFTYVVNGRAYDVSPIKVTVSENDSSIHRGRATAGAPYPLADIMGELNSICRSQTGGALSYITNVMVPTREGVLYYNHVSSDDTGFGVGATERYYYDEDTVGERFLSGLTFVPNSDFNGETTITFTGYSANKGVYSGKIRLTVTGSGNVTFITRAGQATALSSAGFSAACRSVTGREVQNVSFVLPDEDKGLLCYGYSGGQYRYEVTAGEEYYRSRTPFIDQVSFIPAEYYIGTLTLPFSGRDTAGTSFQGRLHIIVVPDRPDGQVSELTTTALRGTTVDFDKFDFSAACRQALGSSASLSYVRFTPPPSSAGTLYYKYTNSGKYDSLVNANTRYYPSRTPKLDDLTFVPAYDRIAPVTIDFVGYSGSGKSFDGTVTIYYRDTGSAGDVITYAATSGQAIPFEPADFDALCESATGKSLSRIEFQYLPDSDEGTLYRNYSTGSGSTGVKVSVKDKIYRSSLSGVAFAPRSDFVGTVELEFNGYATDGTRFTGMVSIDVEEGNSTLRYSVFSGSSVNFDADDFNRVCDQSTDGKLNYVRFQLPDAEEGKLYYRPKSGSTSKNTVSSTSSFYYSTSGSNKLDNVFFTAAANYTGRVSIDYTGFSTSGARFTGTVEIDVAYHHSTTLDCTGTSVPFQIPASDIFSACSPLLDRDISYVVLNALPKSDEGRLYYDYVGYNTGSEAKLSAKYYRDKASYLSRVVFVPKEGFTGTVSLPYTAYDTRGDTVSGTVNIEIIAPDTSVFDDMGGHIWAIPSVDFLYASGVVEGTAPTRYNPAGSIKRGDFVLMLYRMFNLRAAGKKSFSDVPEDSYYAEAIASARAENVVSGESGRFRPEEPITRQDAMVFLRNAMRAGGKTVSTGSTSELYAFADYNSVSQEARSAVISMVHMGIIKGDDRRRLNPTKTISRAEMAVLVHRAMTL